jgi:hypothetical protein
MKRKAYEREIRKLQVDLCYLQDWVKEKKLRAIILFEGRDVAGKGGTIKAITEKVSPRVFRIAALPAPSHREKTQMFVQRYMQHFPAGGEVVSSTAAGTIAPASSMSWVSVRLTSTGASLSCARRSNNTSSMPASS